jgi:hypothetical protein
LSTVWSTGVGGVDGTSLDVGVDDVRAGLASFDICRLAAGGRACSSGNTWARSSGWVVAVEPEHGVGVIIPEGENENHTGLVSCGHGSKASVLVIAVSVVEHSLLFLAVSRGDRVSGDTWDGGLRVGDDNTVLDIEALNLVQVTAGSSTVGQELSDDSEDLVSINNHARTIECLITHSVRVEITSIRISRSSISG